MTFATLSASFTRGPSYMLATRTFRKDRCIEAAAAWVGVTPKELLGSKRARPFTHARFALMLAFRREGWSLPLIGLRLGNRDHTTVMYGIARAEELLVSDADFAELVGHLEGIR